MISPFWNGLVGAGGIDFKRSLAVHPVVSAAESGPFRTDDADMVGRKGLAEGTGIEDVRGLIGHAFDPGIPFSVDIPRLGKHFVHLLFGSV